MTDELTLAEACKELRCSRHTFVKWATEGYAGLRLEAYQRGRRWYVTRQAIEQFKTVPQAPQVKKTSKPKAIDYRKALMKHFGPD